MRKLWFNLLILCALFLAACSQASTAAPSDAATPVKRTKQASNGPAMKCNVVSMTPTQGPTEVSMFPPVSESDWVLGKAKNPAMTIIEYSDFQ